MEKGLIIIIHEGRNNKQLCTMIINIAFSKISAKE